MSKLVKKLRKAAEDLYIYRGTRRDIESAANRLDAIREVWQDDSGQNEVVRAEWPELALALDRACS